jgi:hypothetical protein
MVHSKGDISTSWSTQLAYSWIFVLFEKIISSFRGRSCKEIWTNNVFALEYLNYIIISNAEMAFQVLNIHDGDFASRPSSIIGKYLTFEYSNLTFAPYGDNYRLLRKICVTKLLTRTRLKTFELMRQEEVACMVENILKHNQEGKLVKMRPIFHQLTYDNMCRMMFGKYLDCVFKKEFDDLTDCVTKIGSKFNISDLIPILKPFDVQGIEKQLKHMRNRMENSLSKILNEYRNKKKMVVDSIVPNFVETLLNYDEKLDERSIMGVLLVCTHHYS